MRISRFINSFILFFFPVCISRCFIRIFRIRGITIGDNCRIGFSYINCESLVILDNSSIGHFNIIKIKSLELRGAKIKHFNFVKGNFSLQFDKESWMHSLNKIASDWNEIDRPRRFYLKQGAAVMVKNSFDVTDSITIGEGSLIAGSGSQIWTHAFYLGEKKRPCVIDDVVIGKRCYVESRVVICSGVHICDDVALGAGVTVAKDILNKGLYVNQPLRFIDYDADSSIENLSMVKDGAFKYYRKNKQKDYR